MAERGPRGRRRLRLIVSLAGCLVAALFVLSLSGRTWFDGFLLDASLWVRAQLAEPPPQTQSVAVVAMDAESLASPELRNIPVVLLGPRWGELLAAVAGPGQARAIGFDLLFAFNANGFDQLARNYDLPLFRAVAEARERVVLGRSFTTRPVPPLIAALGREAPNQLGFVQVDPDFDGIVRRIDRAFPVIDPETGQEERLPMLAHATLARAGLGVPEGGVILAPWHHLETIPTYRLVDVLRCAATNPGALSAAFAGRFVLVGTTQPEEDRRVSSDRFLAYPDGTPPPAPADCAQGLTTIQSPSIPGGHVTRPGVYLHAQAIAQVADGAIVRHASLWGIVALSVAMAALGFALGFLTGPWTAFPVMNVVSLGLFAASVVGLAGGIWLPQTLPYVCGFLPIYVAYFVRYMLEGRTRRRIQAAFGRYLSPVIVERLSSEQIDLKLGGETRDCTIMFADLSGFTSMSTKMAPEPLMKLTNEYLTLIVNAVEETGGYVDKFLGDAVMAFWGAPTDDPNHARSAVTAALAATRAVLTKQREDRARGIEGYSVKIGINSGAATVGNVGTDRRYNYTAIGEAVNIAARLESVPKEYGCYVIIGEDCYERVKDHYLCREVDMLRVIGREKPLRIYEPVALLSEASDDVKSAVATFAEALERYRNRKFAEALEIWKALDARPSPTPTHGPSRVMATRAEMFKFAAPGPDWNGVWVRASK